MSDPNHNPSLLGNFARTLSELKDQILPNYADTTISTTTYNIVLKPYCEDLVDTIAPAQHEYAEYQPYWRTAFNGAIGPVATEVVTQVLNAALPTLGGFEKIISHASGKLAGKLASRVAQNSAADAVTKPEM